MDKLQDMRKMVSEVTGIMKDNIEKVVEREEKLNTLEVRTEELQASVSIKNNETKGFIHKDAILILHIHIFLFWVKQRK